MRLQVTKIKQESLGVKSIELQAPDGVLLPDFEPGAHVRVTIPGLQSANPTRAYSLVSDPTDLTSYTIAVLLVRQGNGGSEALHKRLSVGDFLEVSPPKNDFQLAASASHAILIAGGIGVTPILSLARELGRRRASFEVHYVGRGPDRMPLLGQLTELAPDRVKLYHSREEFNLDRILHGSTPNTHVYVCGPHSLIEAVRTTAQAAGVSPRHVHFESFGYRRMPSDRPVELELRNSGITILAEPGRPILEAIETAGIWAPAECRRGECATCVTTIVEGRGDHRDHCLTIDQRSTSICTCVSWATGGRLVLDI
jgi:vanillate O-demethylase ferredoxin subunit